MRGDGSYRIFYEGEFVGDLAEQMRLYLRSRGIHAACVPTNSYISGNGKRFSLIKMIAINKAGTPNFSVIECRDRGDATHPPVLSCLANEFCGLMLKMQYTPGKYTSDKIKPFTYFEKFPLRFQRHLEWMRKMPRTETNLHFRGQIITKRRNIINSVARTRILGEMIDRKKSHTEYLKEAASHKIGLSLPGFGNFCHREFEYFGMGVPVIMPKLTNATHDPLIPNRHYIAVRNVREATEREIAADIVDAYNKYVDRPEALKEIAKNAMDWYDKNVRFPNSAALACNLLGIVK